MTLGQTQTKKRLLRAHKGAVKAGRLKLARYLLQLLNRGALIVSPVDDDAYEAMLAAESCDCCILFNRGCIKAII